MKLEVLYLVVHFVPQTVFTIISQFELINLNLTFQNNILLKLPLSQLMKFLAYNRLGHFELINGQIRFIPGLNRIDLYCPMETAPPIFHIAALMHMHQIHSHFKIIMSFMKYREQFKKYELWTESKGKPDLIIKSVFSYRNVARTVKLRAKRRARTSFTNKIILHQFFNFLSAKGHYDWHLFINH